MEPRIVEKILAKLADLMAQDRFEELETDALEIKSVPSDGQAWREQHKTACAFLNTRGGIIILGIKEEGSGAQRRYRFTGWRSDAEAKVKEIANQFTDVAGRRLDIPHAFPPPILFDFLDGKVAAVLVDELSADLKYAFYREQAYRRVLTGDHQIPPAEIERQGEFRAESIQARELQPVAGVALEGIDLDKLNDYITQLNRPVKIETIKPDLASALPFLQRKSFLNDSGTAATLGVLVCGSHPADVLGFRCQVHGYVDVPQEIARDKQDFANNILPLMENSLAYVLRNIQVGVSIERGGMSRPQYPEELLRETVNNALAHRDYSINRQVIISVEPGRHISIRNPGSFRSHLLIESAQGPTPLLRIVPEAKPRNPKLADVLRVFRKWEGRGIGMATLVNLALQNQIDLPYYRFHTEEVTLYLVTGRLLDDRLQRLFQSFDRYLGERLGGGRLTDPQQLVLGYLIKSEWANERARHTVLLTPDNNHFHELMALESSGLISRHPDSSASYPIFVADRTLMRKDYVPELRAMFGLTFDGLNELHKDILSIVYRFNHFSNARIVSAKQASFILWHARGGIDDIKAFDTFYRQVRKAFNLLESDRFVEKSLSPRGYLLNPSAGAGTLRLPGAQ